MTTDRRLHDMDLGRRDHARWLGSNRYAGSGPAASFSIALSGDQATGVILLSGDESGFSEGLSGDER